MGTKKQPVPDTMIQAVRQFADPQTAHDFFVQIRFPNGVACPRTGCGSARVAYLEKVRRWYCNECKKQFSAKVGTIFEDSPIGLDKWLPAIWLIASNRNGISSYELARALSVTQKTAWFMNHRIREAMASDDFDMLTGTVEVDEAYIGGRHKNKSLSKRKELQARRIARGLAMQALDEKQAVLGMVERGGRVRAWTVTDTQQRTLLPKLRASIHQDATVYTDASALYTHINEFFLTHSSVNHSIEEYVRGNVHTNNIECFWAVLKRTIGGMYRQRRVWVDSHAGRIIGEVKAGELGPDEHRAVNFAAEHGSINVSQFMQLTQRSWKSAKTGLMRLVKAEIFLHVHKKGKDRDPEARFTLKQPPPRTNGAAGNGGAGT